MATVLGSDELTWIVYRASQTVLATMRPGKAVETNNGPLFITTWQLRRGDTAAAFDLSDAEIEKLGQEAVDSVAKVSGEKPFDFPSKILPESLKTLQHLNRAIYKQFNKPASRT